MSDSTGCPCCGSDYGHGPADCPLCRSARRKDMVIRVIIGLMFIVPMLMLFATILLSSGPASKLVAPD